MPEVDVTDQYIRLRQKDPDQFDDFRTIDIDKDAGIKAVLGIRRDGGGSEVQSYLFDKDKWTVDRAKAWVRDHKEEMEVKLKEAGDYHCAKCGHGLPSVDTPDKCPSCGADLTGTDAINKEAFKVREAPACPKCGGGMKYDDSKDAYVCEKCGYSKPNGPKDDEEEESVSLGRMMREARKGQTLKVC